MTNTLLILGGTGLLGTPVVRRLHADGFSVRLLARSPEKARQMFGESVEVLAGDATDRATLDSAMVGCDGVHLTLGGEAELPGTLLAAELAAQHNLGRITYISGCTVCEQNRWFSLVGVKLRAEEAIKASGVPYTIFRPTWPMEMLKNFLMREKVAVLGAQPTPLHWFAADDLGRMVSAAYQSEEAANTCLYVHGPEGIRMQPALERAAAVLKPEVTSVSVMPIWLARLIATVTGNTMMRYGVMMMAYFNKVGERGDPAEANRILGAPTTTLDAWLAQQATSA